MTAAIRETHAHTFMMHDGDLFYAASGEIDGDTARISFCLDEPEMAHRTAIIEMPTELFLKLVPLMLVDAGGVAP